MNTIGEKSYKGIVGYTNTVYNMNTRDFGGHKKKKETAAQIVLSLLPKDGSPVTWGDLKRRAKNSHPHLSPSTLSKHLKRFTRFEMVNREEVKTGRKLPTVFYRRVIRPKRTIREVREMQEKAREEEEFDNIAILLTSQFYRLIYRFALMFFDASKRENVNEAKDFVFQMLDASLVPYTLALTEACYATRDIRFSDVGPYRWSVLEIPPNYFVSKEDELLGKLKKTKPKSVRYKHLKKKLEEAWKSTLY